MTSAATTPPVPLGAIVDGKYRVEAVIGTGGMGIVVAAHHVHLDERVAIKFMRDSAVGDEDAVKRFAREARTAIKIKSEHAARVLDVGSLSNGVPFIVMEYLDGEDLGTILRTRGPLPLEQAAEFVLQACEAIAEAHALGIVHRDLKPANLFVTRRADGIASIKVFDFGIAKGRVTQTGRDLTGKAVALGSPSYMSPEQLGAAKDVDPRADIWALGVTLFEMLTGALPFDAPSLPEVCGKILRDPPRSVRELRGDLPRAVDAIVNKCLEKEYEQRYAHVGELAAALVPFAPARAHAQAQRIGRTVSAAPPPLQSPQSNALDADTIDSATATREIAHPRARPRTRGRSFAVAVALVALGSSIGAYEWSVRHRAIEPTSVANELPPRPVAVVSEPVREPVVAAAVASPPAPQPAPSTLVRNVAASRRGARTLPQSPPPGAPARPQPPPSPSPPPRSAHTPAADDESASIYKERN